MGERLMRYYKYMSDLKGPVGKVELAKATNIPSCIAATEPDAEQTIAKFKAAIESITGRKAPVL